MRRAALIALATAGLTVPAAAGLTAPAAARAAVGAALGAGAASDPASLVDTRDGSLGAGFPQVGAATPFGMVSPGPDTSLPDGSQDPVDYVGYSYQDPDIRGFSLTHFDGAGIHIGGDLPFMPTTGAIASSDPLGYSSPYSHSSETAQPGYYAVTLERYGIRTELTATTRAAMMRFTFPSTSQANVLAEVGNSIDGAQSGSATATDPQTLTGWVKSGVGYRLYFVARFDRPFKASAMPGGGEALTFDASSEPVVTMRVGISYLDAAGADNNLQAEIPASRSFDQVRAAARAAWNRSLRSATVTGGTTAEQETFYDNLYRSMLLPSVLDDADGRYLGMDGAVHQLAPGQHHFSNLSLWDVYRSQLPLLDLVAPRVARQVMGSLLDDAAQNHGVVPRWVQANIDRGIMAGDSGSAALADGAAEGLLTPAQSAQALALLVHQATALPPVWPREHLDTLVKYGYIPCEVDDISPSVTQEYGIDDSAVASLAAALGDQSDAAALGTRAEDWKNLVNPSGHWIEPRHEDGSWCGGTSVSDPTGVTPLPSVNVPAYSPVFQNGYQEETGWQALWAEPQDVAGLATALGGEPVALRRLNTFFSAPLNSPAAPAVPLAQQYASFFGVYYVGDQYTPANEPDLWTPWYYDWYGQPWKAQKVARAEMAAYNQTPTGLPGNDDAGEMSAWYVLAALGLYHAAPGIDAWELSSPAFPRAVIEGGRRSLDIEAAGASRLKPYVHAMSLNGRPLQRTYLTSCELFRGGSLDVTLGALADKSWGTGPGAAPPSLSKPSAAVNACAASLAG